MAGAMALLGIVLMRRRGAALEKLGPGFAAALLAGSSGLFFLPALMPNGWTHGQAVASALSTGFADGVTGALGATFYGSPLLYSAVVPLGLTVLLYGVRKLRPALAGFGFGVAGALLFAAVTHIVDVRFVPELPRPDLAGRQRRGRGPVRDRRHPQVVGGRGPSPRPSPASDASGRGRNEK